MKKARRVMIALFLMAVLCTQLAITSFAFSGNYSWTSGGATYVATVTSQNYTNTIWVLSGTNVYHTYSSPTTITVYGYKAGPTYTANINSSNYADKVEVAMYNTGIIRRTYPFSKTYTPAVYLTIPSSNPSGSYNAVNYIKRYTCRFTVTKTSGDTVEELERGTVNYAPDITPTGPYVHAA